MAPLLSYALEQRSEGGPSDHTSLYERRRRILTSDMGYESPSCEIIILSRDGHLTPDFIHSALHQPDPYLVEIREHWTGTSTETKNLISCATALCSNPVVAHQVTKELQLMSRSVIAVSFVEFFRALVEAEIRHPFYESGFTRIIIKGKRKLTNNQELLLENYLNIFGPCEKKFLKPSANYETACMVTYQFAYHAIFAKTVLNGREIRVTGRMLVQLQMTQKVKGIMGFVKEYLM